MGRKVRPIKRHEVITVTIPPGRRIEIDADYRRGRVYVGVTADEDCEIRNPEPCERVRLTLARLREIVRDKLPRTVSGPSESEPTTDPGS